MATLPPDAALSDDRHGYEYKFALNITPNDYPANPDAPLPTPLPADTPIIPAGDGLLTAPDGSILTPYSVLELNEKSATTQRRQRKRTQDRGGEYVPRPPNPFILFRCWYTAKVHKPGSHDSSEGSLSYHCGQEWQNLGVSQRQIFEEAAKLEKVKHAERYPNYRYKPIHKKGKKAQAAAAAAAAVGSNSAGSDRDDDYRPSARGTTRLRKQPSPLSMVAPPLSAFPAPTSAFTPLHHPTPYFPGMHPNLQRHRRSSSVPIGTDLEMFDPTMRPIELPAAPFLALAGQDMPPRRSRPSLGLSQFNFPRPSQMYTNWNGQADGSVFNYTEMRNSISCIQGLPTNNRHVPPNSGAQQHPFTFSQPEGFFAPFGEQSAVQWTNPNPFATAPSEPPSTSHSPMNAFSQRLMPPDSASSSSSAPSPPADLEIPPHDQAHIPVTPDFLHSGGMAPDAPSGPLPFDLGVFKGPGRIGVDYMYANRPRGLSILGGDGMALGGLAPMQNSDYTHALQSEGLVGEIPSHDDLILEHYLQGNHNTTL